MDRVSMIVETGPNQLGDLVEPAIRIVEKLEAVSEVV